LPNPALQAQSVKFDAVEGYDRPYNLAGSKVLASRLMALAKALHSAGHLIDACEIGRRGVRLYRELLSYDRALALGDVALALALALEHYSSFLSNALRFNEACDATRDVVTLRRDLFSRDPHLHATNLALALCNYASDLALLQRHAEACEAGGEAVAILHRLYNANREEHRETLASTLYNYGEDLRKIARLAHACDVFAEATTLYSYLHDEDPRQYRTQLIRVLNRRIGDLRDLQRYTEAFEQYAILINLQRQCHEEDPKPDNTSALAQAIQSYARDLDLARRSDEASQEYEKALTLYRLICGHSPELYCSHLIQTLQDYSRTLRRAGYVKKAQIVECEDLNLRRKVFPIDFHNSDVLPWSSSELGIRYDDSNPLHDGVISYRLRYAEGLRCYSADLHERGHRLEACQVDRKAVAIIEDFYEHDHSKYGDAFAQSLSQRIIHLCRAGFFHSGAIDVAYKGVMVHRQLYARDLTLRPKLALMLHNASVYLILCNQAEDALPLSQEAVSHFHFLYKSDHSQNGEPLARSLWNCARCLLRLGRVQEASRLALESKSLPRPFGTHDVDDLETDLSELAAELENSLTT
jgi:hypothetical protein